MMVPRELIAKMEAEIVVSKKKPGPKRMEFTKEEDMAILYGFKHYPERVFVGWFARTFGRGSIRVLKRRYRTLMGNGK